MKARIALLEGERRSFENTRNDLLRRIKMLEFALRMERYADSRNSSVMTRVDHAICLLSQVKTNQPAGWTIQPPEQSRCTPEPIQSFVEQG